MEDMNGKQRWTEKFFFHLLCVYVCEIMKV